MIRVHLFYTKTNKLILWLDDVNIFTKHNITIFSQKELEFILIIIGADL